MLLYLESPDLPGQLPRSRGGRCQEAAEADTLSCVGEPSERSKCGPAGAPAGRGQPGGGRPAEGRVASGTWAIAFKKKNRGVYG